MTTTAASLVASAESDITTLVSKLETVKATLVTHIQAQQAAIAAHQAEVDAATALIAKASPGTSPSADNAAAIILTSSKQVTGVVGFLGNNWRYVVIALALGVIAYAKIELHL